MTKATFHQRMKDCIRSLEAAALKKSDYIDFVIAGIRNEVITLDKDHSYYGPDELAKTKARQHGCPIALSENCTLHLHYTQLTNDKILRDLKAAKEQGKSLYLRFKLTSSYPSSVQASSGPDLRTLSEQLYLGNLVNPTRSTIWKGIESGLTEAEQKYLRTGR